MHVVLLKDAMLFKSFYVVKLLFRIPPIPCGRRVRYLIRGYVECYVVTLYSRVI
jgi:hypothetical protein